MPTVTLVTANATRDSLSDDDYRDIYAELREERSLRQFAALAGTTYSIAWWSQYEAGTKTLTYRARCDLRRAVGLPMPPMPVGEAVEAGVDPDASVYRIGDDDRAERVLLLATPDAVTVTWNGTVPQIEDVRQDATRTNVTGVTSFRQRKPYWRPCLSPELQTALAVAGVDAEEALWTAVGLARYGLWKGNV